MEILALIVLAGCADGCEAASVGCWEYLTADCATDVFYCWSDVPHGDRPAHCADAECLPIEWAYCEVVRRLSPDCEC